MRYDWNEPVEQPELSPAFFAEIDTRFFRDAEAFLPSQRLPFDELIPFAELPSMDVLEIGVGLGTHAQLIAGHARTYAGIDLTTYATTATAARLRALEDRRTIVAQMDAEQLAFRGQRFDLIWSWGVIHHSSNTRKVLEEAYRVLRPGGTLITMVYHRNLWSYYLMTGLLGGVARGRLVRGRSLTKAVQRLTDGALARYYTPKEWAALVCDLFRIERLEVYGSKTSVVPLPAGKAKDMVLAAVPDRLGRFLTHRCRLGGFLVSVLVKPA